VMAHGNRYGGGGMVGGGVGVRMDGMDLQLTGLIGTDNTGEMAVGFTIDLGAEIFKTKIGLIEYMLNILVGGFYTHREVARNWGTRLGIENAGGSVGLSLELKDTAKSVNFMKNNLSISYVVKVAFDIGLDGRYCRNRHTYMRSLLYGGYVRLEFRLW
jgi:hypothetical protein